MVNIENMEKSPYNMVDYKHNILYHVRNLSAGFWPDYGRTKNFQYITQTGELLSVFWRKMALLFFTGQLYDNLIFFSVFVCLYYKGRANDPSNAFAS